MGGRDKLILKNGTAIAKSKLAEIQITPTQFGLRLGALNAGHIQVHLHKLQFMFNE
jgi:hypothetical protein